MQRRDYTTTNRPIRTDLEKLIDVDPNSVEILIFKAQNADLETLTDADDVVGSLEHRERAYTWADPVQSKMLFTDLSEIEYLKGYLLGVNSSLEQTLADIKINVVIADESVPMQSVIQWEEETGEGESGGTRIMNFFVEDAQVVGMAPSTVIRYVLSPFIEDGRGV
jgi:hypothetical protein